MSSEESGSVRQEEIDTRVSAALESLVHDSKLFENVLLSVPEYSWDDVTTGEKLGQGGFNSVHGVSVRDCNQALAIKYLKPRVYEKGQEGRLKQGAVDLVVESRFLAALSHPNLIQLKGISRRSESKPFLIMDKLDETLVERMQKWKKRENELPKRYRKEAQLQKHLRYHLDARLQVAMDIAKVLKYLHESGVVYRDLKPENIGFDAQGTVKLFDLGLAKEMKSPLQNGKYQMTGATGSWMYMAPEVAKHWAYDQMVDMYSFGILLWEICSLEDAFADLSNDQHMAQVVKGDVRPPLVKWWPTDLQWLMKKCWSYFAAHRPSWDVVIETLQEIMDDPEMEEPEDSVKGFASLRALSLRKRSDKNKDESGRFVAAAPRVDTPGSPSTRIRGRKVRQRSAGVRPFSLFAKK